MIIIGITGTFGAGKGTVVDYLTKDKGFKHYSVSGYLTEQLIKNKREVNRDGMREIANEIRNAKGSDYIVKKLFKQAKKEGQNAIIESIRSFGEAKFIKNNGYLFAVDAVKHIRYERIKSRASEKDDVTFEEFKIQEKKESKNADPNTQNLPKCISIADYKFNNNDTLENLYKQIDNVVRKIIKPK